MDGERKKDVVIPAIQLGVRKQWREIELGTREWWREYRRFMEEPPAPGEAWLEPSSVRAGEEVCLKLHFRAGAGGISKYGHIAIETPFQPPPLLSRGAVLRARTPYLAVSCTNEKPSLDVTCSASIVDILVQGHPLNLGDTVTVQFAHPLGNPLRMPARQLNYPFAVALDRDNTGRYQRIARFPRLEVAGGCARCLYAAAPAVVASQEPFALRLVALDGFDGSPSPHHQATLRLLCTDPQAELPLHVEMANGRAAAPHIVLRTPGAHTITAIDERNGLIGQTPPIGVDFLPDDWRPWFGDLHGHNEHCDGYGTVDEYYTWAGDVRLLDFGALANHVEGAKRMPVEKFWPADVAKAAEYNKPGAFVTLLGFEWGGWSLWGDKCVYYRAAAGPCFPANDPASDTPQKLFAQLKGRSAIVIPHHSKYGGQTDWDAHDPRWERVVEIYSMWGSSECGGERSIQAAWARGYRLGVIGGTDDHTGHPGTPPGGLAAVFARELTREALFNSMMARRCYATTGARILLDFRVTGAPMGQVIKKGNAVEVRARCAGTAPIEKLEILRNNEPVHAVAGNQRTLDVRWRDGRARAGAYYYVRLTQADGHRAWSSPIWIE